MLGNGTIVRASDGKVLYADRETGNQAVASPVVEQDRLFRLPVGKSELVVQTLPERLADPLKLPMRRIRVDLTGFPKHYLPWHLSSPVIHQGLAYLLNNAGVLTVVDVEAGRVVYQKLLDLDPLQAPNEGGGPRDRRQPRPGRRASLPAGQQRHGAGPRARPRLPADRQEQDRERCHGRTLGRSGRSGSWPIRSSTAGGSISAAKPASTPLAREKRGAGRRE